MSTAGFLNTLGPLKTVRSTAQHAVRRDVSDAHIVFKTRLIESHPDSSMSMMDFADRPLVALAMRHNEEGEAALPCLLGLGIVELSNFLSRTPPFPGAL